jgi:NAD(P)-dependent dehydrogenase (short-subunit alcohol dehydrogenase family)
MFNPFTLEDKTILVTGASSGIGREIAIVCSKMGARLVISGRNEQRLDETLQKLTGSNHIKIVADMSKENDIESLADTVPFLDGFSNNAGITKVVLVKHIKRTTLNDIFTTNTIAPIILTQLLIKKNKINNGGSIVFTSSLSGVYCVHYGESMYAASKGAISGFAKGAALDLAKVNIRVNSVCPGIIQTELFQTNAVLTPEELLEKQKFFPLKRFGQPEDVANAVVYFLSDASSWVTGADLKIDGGYTLI